MQVKNIASLFKVDPSTVYLVDNIDSLVLFPLVSGKFKTSQIVPGVTYEVHGNSVSAFTSASTSSSFGVYTNPSR